MAGGMLAGCGSSNGSNNGSSSSSKSDAKDEVVTLKWIQVGNGMPKDYDEWLAQIKAPIWRRKIGINVDMEIVPWGDWDNRKKPVITNSGELFRYPCSPTRTVTLLEVNTGALMDITGSAQRTNASEAV